jgi:DNA repair exonuclease SbcCD ATPase subunit
VKDDLKDVLGSLEVTELSAGRFKYWVGAFKEIRLSLIDEVLQELEIASSEHAARLGLVDWEIKFQTERENKSGDISYGFNVLLYPPAQKEPVRWESYSGGESQRWQLATTFGLAEVLLARAGITSSLEIYDEPSQHLSPEGVDGLIEVLGERSIDERKTIFYLDHASLDRGLFNGIFTVIKDKAGSIIQAP